MTVKEAKNLTYNDVRKLTTVELRKTLKSVVDANNKQIRRLQAAGQTSGALEARAKTVGADDVLSADLTFKIPRGKQQTRAAMIQQLGEALGYAQSKTGSLSGLKKSIKSFEKSVPGVSRYIHGQTEEAKQTGRQFWNMYNRWKETHPELAAGGTNDALRQAVKIYESGIKNERSFKSRMTKAAKNLYEEEIDDDSEFSLPY